MQKATVTNLDNDTRRVDGAQLGAVAGIDTGTRGTEYFDTFVSRRTTYIGLVAPGGIEVAKNPLPVQFQAGNGIRMAAFTEPKRSTPVGDALSVSLAPMLRPTGDLETHAITYTYDPLNRLTSAYYADGSYFIYTYDAVGNRLTETTRAGTTTYTYDNANRLATVNGVAYTWDNNGNLLSDGVSTYTYDHANRLKSVTTGGTTYTYAYNGLGDRVSQTVGGVTTRYTLDLNAGLTQVLADGTNTYLYGNERIAQYGAGGAEYFLGDALGSVRQMVDGTGTVTLTKSYEPFGDILSSEGAGTTVYGFDGEYSDNNKLIYLRSRYLSTETGRFLSRDTWQGDMSMPLSYNVWLYAYANPITNTDPYGNKPLPPSKSGINSFIDCTGMVTIMGGNNPFITAKEAVNTCKMGFRKDLWHMPFNLGGNLPKTAFDLFGWFLYENYGPNNSNWLFFDANEPLTKELARSTLINDVRAWYYYNGDAGNQTDPRYSGGDSVVPILYKFNNIEYARTILLNGLLSLQSVIGSFYFQVKKIGSDRLGFRIDNDTTLESGTHVAGRFRPKNEGSVETLIESPGYEYLANRPLSEVVNSYSTPWGVPVMSILKSRNSDETTGMNGGGNLYQTYTWTEKYDPCLPLLIAIGRRGDLLDDKIWSGWENATSWKLDTFPSRPRNR